MEKSPKTSFIPKQNANTVPKQNARRRRFGTLGFAATVLFLGSLILAIGVFAYKAYSEDQLTERQAELADSRSAFSQSDIQSIRELDQRISTAQMLLDQHLSVSTIFDILEERTQSSVQFTRLQFNRRPSGNASLSLSGAAPRFNTVALQKSQFGDEAAFSEPNFAGIGIVQNEVGGETITFEVLTEINEGVISYTVAPQQTPATTTDATTTDTTTETGTSTEPANDGAAATTTDTQ